MRRAFALLLIAPALAVGARADEGAARRFTWRPSFETRSVYDSNAFLTENKDSDIGLWMVPRLELDYRTTIGSVGADLGAEIPRYFDNSSLNDTYWRVKGYGELGLWPGVTLRVSDALTPQPIMLGLPDDSPSNLAQANRANVEMRVWRELPGGREVSGGVVGSRFDSENFPALVPNGSQNDPVLDDDFRPSFTEASAYAEARNPIFGEGHALFARGRLLHRNMDTISEGDFLDVGGMFGYQGRIAKVDLELAGGAGLLDARGLGNEVHALGLANVGWRHERSGLRFKLGFHHQLTPDLMGKAFIDTTGKLSVERYFGLRTSATVTGFLSQLDSNTLDETNLFGGVEVGMRRQISRNFQVNVGYRFWDNGGDFSLDDFQQHQATIGFSYRR
jgi:hypothetical protein